MQIGLIVLNENYRIYIVPYIELSSQFLSYLGLQRLEFETFFVIVFDNKIDGTVAEITDAVKKYDRTHS